MQTICLIVTILLYDAILSVFCLTLVEGVHLYRMIVMVYGIERDLKKLYLLIGWGNVTFMIRILFLHYSHFFGMQIMSNKFIKFKP